jgi:large subunit ribosomal protein L29
MKAAELKAKSVDDLEKELASLLKAKFGLRMQLATQQTTNVAQVKKMRRDVARVKTVLREKALQI